MVLIIGGPSSFGLSTFNEAIIIKLELVSESLTLSFSTRTLAFTRKISTQQTPKSFVCNVALSDLYNSLQCVVSDSIDIDLDNSDLVLQSDPHFRCHIRTLVLIEEVYPVLAPAELRFSIDSEPFSAGLSLCEGSIFFKIQLGDLLSPLIELVSEKSGVETKVKFPYNLASDVSGTGVMEFALGAKDCHFFSNFLLGTAKCTVRVGCNGMELNGNNSKLVLIG